MKRAMALVVSAAAVLALAGAALSTREDVWKQLRRPLRIPHITAGTQCPASPPDSSVDFASYGVGQGYGPGPAYPIFGGNSPRAGLEFDYPPIRNSIFRGSVWGGQKVLWFLLPDHGDRVLVRGRQLDGPYGVRFDLRRHQPVTELRISHAGDRPSETRLRTGGCYGYQIDGPDYSSVIVFKARLNCLATPIDGQKVHVGPLTGLISPQYDVVNGRFRLHAGDYRDKSTGLSQKIPWFISRHAERFGGSVVVRGRRLAPPGRTFKDVLQAAYTDDGSKMFPSSLSPPASGCWRLTFTSDRMTASILVLVRNG